MSKSITSPLRSHIGQELTTLATCCRIDRRDGQIFAFTDHDKPITPVGIDADIDGLTYEAMGGYTPTESKQSSDLSVDGQELRILYSDDVVKGDLQAGVWDGAEFRVFTINWADYSLGILKGVRGQFGGITLSEDFCTVELRGMLDLLQQPNGRVYGAGCDADLGDSRCGIDLDSSDGYTVTGAVTGVTDASEFADSGRTEADDEYTFGFLTWTGGDNNGRSVEVADYAQSGGGFVLALPMPDAIQIGDTYSVYSGCDKQFSTCKDKFSNAENFRGFPHVPQEDIAVRAYTADTTTTSRSSAK